MTIALPDVDLDLDYSQVLGTYPLDYPGWSTTASRTEFVLTPNVVAQGADFVRRCMANSAHEPTAAWNRFGVPSLIARVDCTITDSIGGELTLPAPTGGRFDIVDGPLGYYETELRPAGFGICQALSPDFAPRLWDTLGTWDFDFRVAVSPDRRGHDELAWLSPDRVTVGPDVPEDGSLVIVRAEPWQRDYAHLAGRSLSLLETKGSRSYGEQLGLWRRITSLDELPEPGTGAFVVKPLASSKGEGIIGVKSRSAEKRQGLFSRNKGLQLIQAGLDKYGAYYLQDYVPAMRLSGDPGRQFLILRIFYILNLATGELDCPGGTWNLRPHYVVHGASNTTFGPLSIG